MPPRRRSAPLLLLLSALLPAGCQREEPIRRFTITQEQTTAPGAGSDAHGHAPSGPASASAVDAAHAMPAVAAGPQRMLAAVVPHEGTAWFFKVVGPKDAMAAQTEPFRRLVESVSFAGAGAPPTWTLPEGYTQRPGSGMRFATIQVAAPERPLDLSVSALRVQGELNAYLLMNVNRWRQQLGLEPTTRERLFDPSKRSGELTELALKGGAKAYLVDLSGEGGGTAAMPAAPLGGRAHPPMAGAIPGLGAGPSAAPPGLSYQAPEGWTAGPAGGMRSAAFTIKDGDRAAELTVIALAAGSGDLLSNVNRWREQVGLGPVDEAGLKAIVQDVPVAGGTGQRVELVGPADATPREAILGVVHERGDQVWFLKLTGDAALVEREREHFDEFVRSLTFDGPNGGDHGQ